ncbi:hypothetical protein [Nesterenkonia sandarakina]|uniref:Uncharacterized protein n=1 Tax=Nesterenkonia sandarakina TaxID=272918 RepID=A0A7Z0EAV5_9MICC|nr:hypothetical protein [Nesterenkonia sandarakina]NYJ17815.1 hypothetical protein [Nesterenkonia sandarakina]
MALTPDSLLAGPRGRRLCLEFALASERHLHPESLRLAEVANEAAEPFEPGDLKSRRYLGRTLFGRRTPPRPPAPQRTPVDVAAALDDTDLADSTEDLLRFVLGDVVAFARYWQEPEGSDLLAATAELRDPLLRVATHILASPAAAWWDQDVELHDQACVQWPDIPGFELAGEPPTVLLSWREEQDSMEHRALRVRRADPTANWSGEWWSRPPERLLRSVPRFSDQAPVVLYLVEDGFGWETAHTRRLWIPRSPRVFEVHTSEDWAQLCRDFPLEVTGEKRHDWYRTTGRSGRWVIPDWQAVAQQYDGVHLSVAGYLSAAGRAIDIDIDAETASVIAGWNPGETWWLTAGPGLGTELTHWQFEESLHWRQVESCAQEEYPPAG